MLVPSFANSETCIQISDIVAMPKDKLQIRAVISRYILYQNMKNCVFWDVRPCGSYKNRRFGGT
jgi:hypothetical protein